MNSDIPGNRDLDKITPHERREDTSTWMREHYTPQGEKVIPANPYLMSDRVKPEGEHVALMECEKDSREFLKDHYFNAAALIKKALTQESAAQGFGMAALASKTKLIDASDGKSMTLELTGGLKQMVKTHLATACEIIRDKNDQEIAVITAPDIEGIRKKIAPLFRKTPPLEPGFDKYPPPHLVRS